MGHLVVPLKAVLPFYGQAANHPLPSDLAYADGSVLTTASQSIIGSNYTLPDLRNKFIIGADRTSQPNMPGSYITYISNMTASGNSYNYQNIDVNDYNYVVQSGDYLQYHVFYPSANIPAANPAAAVDLYASDGSVLRSVGYTDQNGVSMFSDFRTYATDTWYIRRAAISGTWVGKTIISCMLAHEYDGTYSGLTTLFSNICITNTAGDQVNYWIWQAGDSTPDYSAHAVSSATFVSGTALSLLAPGPDGESGTHQKRMRTRHIPSHTHTASSSSTDGDHAHSASITDHGAHNHNPATGGNFSYGTANGTFARSGATYRNITCTMTSSGGGGSHAHSASGPNDGAHGHNVTVSTTSSGGTNATASPFDPRPRWFGVIWTLKTGKPTSRAQSIPMGTIIMWYADTQNETLPNSYSYCDGTTIASGSHSVPNAAGSLAYTLTLPDLRNRHLIGADRTKNFGQAGSTADGPAGASGPGATGGLHSISITVANLINHSHSGSTDTQWSTHNHTWTVSANASHVHGGAANYPESSTGGTEIQATGGAVVDEFKGTGTASTGTTTNDAHSHTIFNISFTGNHGHTITVNATGSGTAWDNRSPAIGVIFLMKTTVGLTSAPLKTIVGFRHTTQNETAVPSDGTWALCDGSTLTAGNFDMTANSGGNYVLPDFRKFFAIGADRTKVVANTGGTTDTAADAPGPKGSVGSVTVTLTSSNMPSHIHAGSVDSQGGHSHGGSFGTGADGGHNHGTGCHTYWCTTDAVLHTRGSTSYDFLSCSVDTYSSVLGASTQSGHGLSDTTTGAHGHTITVNAMGAGGGMHQRPRHKGMVFYMKVKR